MPGVEEFLWAEEATEATVAVVEDPALDAATVVGRLGPVQARDDLSLFAALELQGSLYEAGSDDRLAVVQADRFPGRDGPRWVTIEPNGFRASSEPALLLVADGACAASFFWNVNAVMRFVWVDGGAVIAAFDPLLEPEAAPPEGADLDFDGHPRAAAMALLERVSGVALSKGWLEAPKPTFVVAAPFR